MKILVSFIFAIAMGFLEAAVVVYLRELYYSNGFKISEKVKFPFIKFGPVAELKPFSKKLIITELGREFATIIMLVTFAILVGDELISKIAYFLLAFGIWDLFYYIFLKMLINWPESFGTTDVFFLIPVPWIGPVGLPITCSIVIIIIGLIILI